MLFKQIWKIGRHGNGREQAMAANPVLEMEGRCSIEHRYYPAGAYRKSATAAADEGLALPK